MAGVLEEHRRRLALGLSLVGICLVLVGFWLIVQHQSELDERLPQQTLSAEQRVQLAKQLRTVLFFLVLLVGIFSISVFAFLRWSRSFRRVLLRRPNPPTEASDVWVMHKLPEEEPPVEEPPGPEPEKPETP